MLQSMSVTPAGAVLSRLLFWGSRHAALVPWGATGRALMATGYAVQVCQSLGLKMEGCHGETHLRTQTQISQDHSTTQRHRYSQPKPKPCGACAWAGNRVGKNRVQGRWSSKTTGVKTSERPSPNQESGDRQEPMVKNKADTKPVSDP